MRSITLDTSCVLNFLGVDQDADAALSDIVGAAMAGRVSVRASARAFEEVASLDDERAREQRLLRLRAFGCIEVASHQTTVRDRLAIELHKLLFPNAEAGSRTDEHNRRDCLQLATHAIIGRSVFCTLDGKLLKRAGRAAQRGVRILSPAELLQEIEEDRRAGALPGLSSIAVRDAVLDQDEAAIREVLEPLAADYPAFSEWLTGKLAARTTRVRVGLLQERVGAVALSAPKDGTERVVKLSAFYVAGFAQDQGLGANLLWSELRTWARHGIEKVYVTVSSRHPELVEFLHSFGFLIEGVSARRYQGDTAEIVLAKHFVRRVVSRDGLQRFADVEARAVFAAPRSVGASASIWALSPRAPHPSFAWEGDGATAELVASESGTCVRRWDLLELERIFHPTRFPLLGRKALLVPIQPAWADAMLEYAYQQPRLLDSQSSDKLLLRADNAYYCHPTALDAVRPGAPILFFVSGGSGLVGEARVTEVAIDIPEELYARFGGLGIYEISQIAGHVAKTGNRAGRALAMRFASYVPFPQAVGLERMSAVLGRRLIPQGITPVSCEEFEQLRRTGGLEW